MVKLITAKKFAASTLLEVLISMIIILVVFGIAMLIFNNVFSMALSQKKLKAQGIVRKEMMIIENEEIKESKTVSIDSFQIEINVSKDSLGSHLKKINIIAYDNNNSKVAELNKLVLDEQTQ